jgi:hypothetical protein
VTTKTEGNFEAIGDRCFFRPLHDPRLEDRSGVE